MFDTVLIVGGSGYIGWAIKERLVKDRLCKHVVIADLRQPAESHSEETSFVLCDVRRPLSPQLPDLKPDWIFNLAAVHREPGHEASEYFETNIPGARNVVAYAEEVGCQNLYFSSSIAVYGNPPVPMDEAMQTSPETPYGISKLCAELIHEAWQSRDPGRRLVVVRPGVVYGPGDPGNILRMIKAIQKGYFVVPGNGKVRKSYAYIEGLVDSVLFTMGRPEHYLTYNYVERETDSLGELVDEIRKLLKIKLPRISAPTALLVAVASVLQITTLGQFGVHPVRVLKAAKPTHVLPKRLVQLGFDFKYDFAASLRHWMKVAPEDFGVPSRK